jgi:hypothetical protein
MVPLSQPVFEIDKSLFPKPKEFAKVRDNLSAIVAAGSHLYLGGDEGTLVDRMTRDGKGNFGAHRRFDLAEILDLPDRGKKVSEIDIEGLDVDDGFLWLIGSHSQKRPKREVDASDAKNFRRVAEVTADANRFTLARVPLNDEGEPVAREGRRVAARLKGDKKGNQLLDALRKDKLIGPFCAIPSKDNGLDVEGLAVRGGRVFAGLRGPVLRGWAVVLDFAVAPSQPGRLTMTGRLRKHLLDLEGLGVRELAIRGRDLLVLAGPTMDLDGPVHVFLWKNARQAARDSFVPRDRLVKLLDIPYGHGDDHAEGIALLDDDRLMVCYDSPAKSRLTADGQVRADLFAIGRAGVPR